MYGSLLCWILYYLSFVSILDNRNTNYHLNQISSFHMNVVAFIQLCLKWLEV